MEKRRIEEGRDGMEKEEMGLGGVKGGMGEGWVWIDGWIECGEVRDSEISCSASLKKVWMLLSPSASGLMSPFIMIPNGASGLESASKWMFDPCWVTLADQAVAMMRTWDCIKIFNVDCYCIISYFHLKNLFLIKIKLDK